MNAFTRNARENQKFKTSYVFPRVDFKKFPTCSFFRTTLPHLTSILITTSMPSDMKQRSSRHQPNRTNLPISLTKLLILLFLTICYSLIAIHNNYPPYNWIDKYFIKKNETPARPAGFVRLVSPLFRMRIGID